MIGCSLSSHHALPSPNSSFAHFQIILHPMAKPSSLSHSQTKPSTGSITLFNMAYKTLYLASACLSSLMPKCTHTSNSMFQACPSVWFLSRPSFLGAVACGCLLPSTFFPSTDTTIKQSSIHLLVSASRKSFLTSSNLV